MQSLRVGWSAVLLPIGTLQKKKGLKEEIDEVIRKEKLDFMLVSSTVREKEVRRELMVTCPEGCSEELKRKIEKMEQTLETRYNCSRNAQNPHLLETTKEFSRKSLAKEIAQLLNYDCLFKPTFAISNIRSLVQTHDYYFKYTITSSYKNGNYFYIHRADVARVFTGLKPDDPPY